MADLGADRAVYGGDKPEDVLAADRAGIDSAHLQREPERTEPIPVDPTYTVSDRSTLVDIVAGATVRATE
ncbi:MAG: hypothetical protein ABEI98_03830 [Halorhabdus sp.]